MLKHPFAIACIFVFSVVAIAAIGTLIYYQSLKDSPQYSMALLVDAAERNDETSVADIVDVDAVVDDFVPQVASKAIELYGRGQSPDLLGKVALLARPLLPAVKDRARAELPQMIRDKTKRLSYVPFFAMVLGADQYLDITVTGESAVVKTKDNRGFQEIKMRRTGDRWRIVGIADEKIATDIARTIGQQVIALATSRDRAQTAERLGIGNLAELLKQAEALLE